MRRSLVDRLQLEVGVETLGAELASDAARLHSTERGGGVQHVMVDADAASLHPRCDVSATFGVAGPHAAAEPKLGVVGNRYSIVDTVVGNHGEHRSEDLLGGDCAAVVHVGEDRGLHEPAAILLRRATASSNDAAALGAPLRDVPLDALALTGTRQRTDLRGRVEGIWSTGRRGAAGRPSYAARAPVVRSRSGRARH